MRVLLLITFLGSSALADKPCVLSGDADLPKGKLWAGSHVVGTTKPFEYQHRVAIPVAAELGERREVTISNALARLTLSLEPSEPIAAVVKRTIAFGPFIPDRGAELVVHGFDRKGLIVAIDCPPELACDRKVSRVSCADLRLTLNGEQTLQARPKGVWVAIAKGEVPIASDEKSAATDTLIVPTDSFGLMLGVRGDKAHLWWDVSNGVVDGWVPARAVSISKPTVGSGGGSLPGKRDRAIEIIDSETLRCRREAPLLVKVDGEALPFGTLKARTVFKRSAADAIELAIDGIVWAAGVEVTIDWLQCDVEKAQR